MSNEKRVRIAANIVTYNRKQLLGECLDALLNQTYPLDAIYIIDNASTDGTPEFLIEKGFIDKPLYPDKEPIEAVKSIPLTAFPDRSIEIHYVRMPENTGGAGGQYEGIKRGYEAGFDWLWLMDDDAEPENECLKNLIEKIDSRCVVLCPYIKGKDGFQNYHYKKLNFLLREKKWDINNDLESKIEIDACAFVGPVIKVEAIKQIGLPFKDFFIWYDDTEYIYRFKKIGKIYLIKGAIILHKDKKITKNDKESLVGSIWKKYYYIRNYLIFSKKYLSASLYIVAIIVGMVLAIKSSLSLLLKWKVNYYISLIPIKGFIDGIKGLTGKTLDINEVLTGVSCAKKYL